MVKVSSRKIKPICRMCGKMGLRWKRIHEKWLLYEKKAPHRCPKSPLSLNELEKLNED